MINGEGEEEGERQREVVSGAQWTQSTSESHVSSHNYQAAYEVRSTVTPPTTAHTHTSPRKHQGVGAKVAGVWFSSDEEGGYGRDESHKGGVSRSGGGRGGRAAAAAAVPVLNLQVMLVPACAHVLPRVCPHTAVCVSAYCVCCARIWKLILNPQHQHTSISLRCPYASSLRPHTLVA
jgi:hypothetical protein